MSAHGMNSVSFKSDLITFTLTDGTAVSTVGIFLGTTPKIILGKARNLTILGIINFEDKADLSAGNLIWFVVESMMI